MSSENSFTHDPVSDLSESVSNSPTQSMDASQSVAEPSLLHDSNPPFIKQEASAHLELEAQILDSSAASHLSTIQDTDIPALETSSQSHLNPHSPPSQTQVTSLLEPASSSPSSSDLVLDASTQLASDEHQNTPKDAFMSSSALGTVKTDDNLTSPEVQGTPDVTVSPPFSSSLSKIGSVTPSIVSNAFSQESSSRSLGRPDSSPSLDLPSTQTDSINDIQKEQPQQEPPDEDPRANPELDENLALMDPDNPLLKRVQDALKQQLTQANEEIDLEIREKEESLRKATHERETLGVELYTLHHRLRQFQVHLTALESDVARDQGARVATETQLVRARQTHDDERGTVVRHQRAWQDRQRELETLMRTHRHLEQYADELRSTLMTTRRVTMKSEQALVHQEEEKRKQDVQIQALSERVDVLESQRRALEQQMEVQKKELAASKNTLQEANLEMEALHFEKRQLFHQWKSGLLGLERRQELLTELDQSVFKERETLMSMEHELTGYQKTLDTMQMENETLQQWHTQLAQETNRLESQIQQTHSRQEECTGQYHVIQTTLEQHEHALKQSQLVRQSCLNELNANKKQVHLAQQKCHKLDLELHEQMQWQQSIDKSMIGTQKDVQKLLHAIQDKATQVAMHENQVAAAHLEGTKLKQWNEQLHVQLTELDTVIQEKNGMIEKYEVELRRGNDDMTKKQSEIDFMNKKLSYLLSHATEEALGPLEATIHNLTKLVSTKEREGWELQQFWLKNQNELVLLTKKSSELSDTLATMKMRLTILNRKKQLLNQEFDAQEKEIKYHLRNIKALQNEMTKINGLLSKQMSVQTQLEENNLGLEQEFRYRLKEAELASLRLEQRVRDLKSEKEQAFIDLMDAERQIMLWEKKIQLAKETREALDPNIGAQEIKEMKQEIHRMELRLQNLQREQEKLIKEMEKGVLRRETIATRSKLRGRGYSQASLSKQIEELTKKLKWSLADLRDLDQDARTLSEAEATLQSQLNEMQQNIQLLQNRQGYLLNEVQAKLDEKTMILNEITLMQKKSKRYQLLKNGKYAVSKGSGGNLDFIRSELQKVQENLSKFEKAVEMLMAEHQSSQLGSVVDSLQYHFASARQFVVGQ